MRLRNIKEAENLIKKSKYIVDNLEEYRGSLKKLFNNDNPIYIEIGMGKGNFILNNAIKNPNINYIGIEKYASVLVKAVEKIEKYDLCNLKLACIDAKEIDKYFFKEVETLFLNFSDPWPKTRHEKRRLTSPNFLEKYDLIFKEKNHIIMKTDNRKLFEYSVITFNDKGYKINNLILDLYNDNIDNNVQTEYEIKFSSKGYPIYKIEVTK